MLSGSPSSLQAALNIVSHFGRRYRVNFNADKTKLVVTGSLIDMQYFMDTSPWTLNGERVSVVENNEHLGLVVSGTSEEQKNVDNNIKDCRKSLFGLLGPAFAFNCQLSPAVQLHLWRTYNLPILLSGLSALPIRPVHFKSLTIFHNKTLRGFLKLSSHSPIPGLHFLLGELPIEAKLHLDILSLFYSIWANPHTTVHKVVAYILKMTDDSSTTWTSHLRINCKKYNLPDPLHLIEREALWCKERWKTLTKTLVTAHHERELRRKAASNSKMTYLNVQVAGLSGHPHPALQNIHTTQDVKKLRFHTKFLCGDFLTGERLGLDQGTNPQCRLCLAPIENTEHILVKCRSLHDVRERLLPELLNTVAAIDPACQILINQTTPHLTQFLLDCTSLNLPNSYRLSPQIPGTNQIFSIARDWCFALTNERRRQLTAILELDKL